MDDEDFDEQKIHAYLDRINGALALGRTEVARAYAHDLHRKTLVAIANGAAQPVELARLALITLDIRGL